MTLYPEIQHRFTFSHKSNIQNPKTCNTELLKQSKPKHATATLSPVNDQSYMTDPASNQFQDLSHDVGSSRASLRTKERISDSETLPACTIGSSTDKERINALPP